MAKLNNLSYAALNASGDNYLQWALDTKIHLKSKDLCECIEDEVECAEKDKYKAIMHIRHHLAESLKNQYLTIEDPLDLWTKLKGRYGHQKTVLLPKTQFDWKNLRIQDYKSVDEYNSELFKIVSILRLCGTEVTEKDLLEKTFSTFHSNNILLQQQYREKGFKTYANLISCLLLAEQNNELLMMNSALRPPGIAPLPKVHKVDMTKKNPQEPKEPKETKESNYVHRDKYGCNAPEPSYDRTIQRTVTGRYYGNCTGVFQPRDISCRLPNRFFLAQFRPRPLRLCNPRGLVRCVGPDKASTSRTHTK
ncbi:PREDICTED: uncharacterized protein LOC109127146 isoform X1 [Camelina sativa]|uniref:Uncharacterized protein LOC109127146 isoform X1 n=1 Tax=Camelina sativa TaxID=90675 RepID=A0ABM1QJM5_CAMSA|nr:PREDICTED: uncharacterized protein LOC109127146 isoform X1 [Camelina sativa]